MPVTFQARFPQAIRDRLLFDDAKRRVRPHFAISGQLFDPRADLIERGTFIQAFPCGDQAQGGHPISLGFLRRFANWFGIDKTVAR